MEDKLDVRFLYSTLLASVSSESLLFRAHISSYRQVFRPRFAMFSFSAYSFCPMRFIVFFFLSHPRPPKTMGFEDSSIQTIFDIVAGLIHLGELEFEAQDEDEAAILSEDEENM